MIRRRWFQFSLRSLLIVTTVAAVWPAYHANSTNRQRYAIEAIEKKGGEVQVQGDGTIKYVFLPFVQTADLSHLACLDSARSLKVTAGEFDSATAPITGLAELESITLFDMNVKSDGLRLLASLPSLRYITFNRVKFDGPDTIKALFNCNGLSDVTFAETKIGEGRLKELCKALPSCRVWVESGNHSGHVLNRSSRLIRP